MRAVRVNRLGDTEVLELEEIVTPEPNDDQLLIKIAAIGVNPVDTYIRAGHQGYDPQLPYTPGFDGAGVVEKVGKNIQHVSLGSRVYLAGSISGTYAEYALCLADQVQPLPDHISFAQGACLYVAYVSAYRSLIQRGQAKPGETVLIHGASGAVGIAAMQFAKQIGLEIIATASSPQARQWLTDQGAHAVLDHSDPDHFDQIMQHTHGRGVDLILEMKAEKNLAQDLKILAAKGRVVIVGNLGTVEINPRDTMACDGAILGMSLMNISRADQTEIHHAIQAGLACGSLAPLIAKEYRLDQARQAHQQIGQTATLGKIILTP